MEVGKRMAEMIPLAWVDNDNEDQKGLACLGNGMREHSLCLGLISLNLY